MYCLVLISYLDNKINKNESNKNESNKNESNKNENKNNKKTIKNIILY